MANTAFHEPFANLPGDVRMPLLGLGTWDLRGSAGRRAVAYALEAGYRHIDTATGYANEAQVGAALRDSGLPRDEVFLTTKMPPDHVGREMRTIKESLDALGTDHVDLWLIHWPPGGTAGVESWRVFVDVLEEGLARAIGVSNYSHAQIDELIHATGATPAVNQIRWSPFIFDQLEFDGLRERGVVLEGYSPFKASQLRNPVLAEIAERHDKSTAQVVVRWHIDHGIVVIPKSAQPERISGNADVFDFSLTKDEIAAIDALSTRN